MSPCNDLQSTYRESIDLDSIFGLLLPLYVLPIDFYHSLTYYVYPHRLAKIREEGGTVLLPVIDIQRYIFAHAIEGKEGEWIERFVGGSVVYENIVQYRQDVVVFSVCTNKVLQTRNDLAVCNREKIATRIKRSLELELYISGSSDVVNDSHATNKDHSANACITRDFISSTIRKETSRIRDEFDIVLLARELIHKVGRKGLFEPSIMRAIATETARMMQANSMGVRCPPELAVAADYISQHSA